MSKKVVTLLNKYGPMLSGELARKFEHEYGASNTAARQALSRAKKPVNKICTLSFDKNQKFFYLESQYIVECKATQSALDHIYVEKWLSQTIHRIRTWALSRYQDGQKLKFQLWSLGGFTPEATSLLTSAATRTRKYKIEFFDKSQIIDMAKAHKVQPVVEVLQQHFQAPLEKAIKKHLK